MIFKVFLTMLGVNTIYTYNHHHTETLFLFTIFVTMSRPRSIYVVSNVNFSFSTSFSLWLSYNLVNTDMFFCLFCRICSIMSRARVLLSICWIFSQFQPGVAYKSVAYNTVHFILPINGKISCITISPFRIFIS